LQLCADGGYQPSLGVLGVPLIMVLDNVINTSYLPVVCCHPGITIFRILHYLPHDKLGVAPDVEALDAQLNSNK
jgi:energy-converting hydrogenase Eha subunit B